MGGGCGFHFSMTLSINSTIFERVDTFSFLGLHISHDLRWKIHIQTLSQKLSKITGILHRLKEEYPSSILKSIYNSLMLPHLHCCIVYIIVGFTMPRDLFTSKACY